MRLNAKPFKKIKDGEKTEAVQKDKRWGKDGGAAPLR